MEARWLLLVGSPWAPRPPGLAVLGLVCSLLAGCWVKEKEIRRKINVIDAETADTGSFSKEDDQEDEEGS